MGTLLLIVLIGAAAYFVLRQATKRGTNTVRAYMFLRAMSEGASVQEANQIARIDLTSSSHHTFVREAQEYVRTAYGGKQLPMIADAMRRGLVL